MNLNEAKEVEANANNRWMVVRVNKTEYYFYADLVTTDDCFKTDNGDYYIYGDMVKPHHRVTNATRWYLVSNATFVRYEDK